MNLGELLDLAVTIVSDKDPDRQITPYEFDLLLKSNNIKHFKQKIGLPEEYQPGMPLPRQTPEITKKITEDIRPFKVFMGKGSGATASPLSVDDGMAEIPDDYYYHLSMQYRWIKNGVMVKRHIDEVDDLEWSNRQADPLTKGTKKHPICNYQSDHIRFQPSDIGFVDFTYLRLPVDPVYAVKWDNGYAEYDPANSTQLEWDEVNQLDILHKVIADMGFSIKKGEVIQYAEQRKAEGV